MTRIAVAMGAASAAIVALGVGLIYPPAGIITAGLGGFLLAAAVLRGARP